MRWETLEDALAVLETEREYDGYFCSVQDAVINVEYYEQDMDTIQIRGHSYNEKLELHSSWVSTSITIDGIKGKIFYTYSVNSFVDSTNNIGCAEFDFERKKCCKYPLIIHGFSTDIQIGKRIKSYEEKLTDKKIIKTKKELDFAQIAFEKYNAVE